MWTVWCLREGAEMVSPIVKCPTSVQFFNPMNIIVWNCRGARKPSFQKHVGELVRNHNPVMSVVMETLVGGSKAKEISDKLPFDRAVHTKTIGYAGGLWLLWDSDRVDVTPLANTEQEIHAIVKVQNFDSS